MVDAILDNYNHRGVLYVPSISQHMDICQYARTSEDCRSICSTCSCLWSRWMVHATAHATFILLHRIIIKLLCDDGYAIFLPSDPRFQK